MVNRNVRKMAVPAALAFAAVMMTAPAATAGTAENQNIAASCYAQSCEGKWPDQQGCAADAITPVPAKTSPESIIVELRYSPTCRAAWGRIRQGIPNDRVRVHSSDGSNYARDIITGRDTYTQMVNDAGLLAWACVRADLTGSLTCTDKY